jgi:hypothetical protein
MKIFIVIVLVLVSIIVLFFLIGLFLKKEYIVTKAVFVNRPKRVFLTT